MSDAHDPFSFDAEYGDPDLVRAAKDPNCPPRTGPEWEPGGRASDIPVEPRGDPSPFADLDEEADNPVDEPPLCPNRADISRHLYALFPPEFVKAYPDAWIEIAIAARATDWKPEASVHFSPFNLPEAINYAEKANKAGRNIYVGPSLRQGTTGPSGRSKDTNFLASIYSWSDLDGAGDFDRVSNVLKANTLQNAILVMTGTVPHKRAHPYFRFSGVVPEAGQQKAANVALKTLLGTDDVDDACRLMRLAGCINYPSDDKRGRGYVPELVTLHIRKDAPSYTVEQLTGLTGKTSKPNGFDFNDARPGRTDDELIEKLEASRVKNWHNNIRAAIATMIGRGWSDSAIRLACAQYCKAGADDPDLAPLIEGARLKWGKPDEEAAPGAKDYGDEFGPAQPPQPPELLGWDAGEDDAIPPPRGWLLGTSFCRGFASSLLGDGGVGKTAVRYAQMLSLATKLALTGEWVFERCRVLILSLEDGPDELRRRLRAARLHHKVGQDELKGWLFMDALGRKDGKLMTLDQYGRPTPGILAARLERTIVERQIDIVMLDPFIKTHGLAENDNNNIDAVAQILTDVAIKYNIAVDVPHHMAKGPADPGNANKGRGASALKDALRLVRTATSMTPEEAKALGRDEAARRRLIRIDDAKLNIAPAHEARWLRLIGVDLGNATLLYPNGDNVQTVEPWTPPNLFADISVKVINQILDEIDAGPSEGDRYSDARNVADPRAAWSVVAKHCPGKGKGPASRVIDTWKDSGLLVEKNYHNPRTRKAVSGLWVDNLKRPT
jgi:hypothetical protein